MIRGIKKGVERFSLFRHIKRGYQDALQAATTLKGYVGNFKPPKQKSQTSLVFGMNALVPLGTIKTL